MYLYGGKDGKSILTDFLYLDLSNLKWSEVKFPEEERPSSKINYCMLTHENSIMLIGGNQTKTECFEYNIIDKSWTRQVLDISPIVATFNHLGNVVDGDFYIFGKCIEFKRQNDLSKFINKKKYSDIKLVIKKRHVIRAHKIILARCEFFDGMFNSSMREQNSKVFHINDVSFPIMIQLIKFLYTDQCEVTLDNVMSLFKAADVYGIKKLKFNCEQTLIDNNSIQNAASTFRAAD